ncbi:MAG: murein peptide amidase A [Phycisphaerales bacterium]|nr:murein peptide amidase A [Phycisphaerales bacterium]
MTLHRFTLGRSVEGRRIEAHATDARCCEGLILGGVHGDEPKSVYVVRCLLAELKRIELPRRRPRAVTIVPVVNPDGLVRGTRRNARKVDLNRNFPTRDWSPGPVRRRNYGGPRPLSEPESRAVHRLVERIQPAWIVTVHSIDRQRFCNNYDGPGLSLAERFARSNGYPVTASIGYPTPGSFGTWAGRELGIAVLTLELPSHRSREQCWRENREALLSLITGSASTG